MPVQPIRLFGDPVLRTPAVPVADFDKELRRLVADLTDTMLAAPGAGLAAPQIGAVLLLLGQVEDRVDKVAELALHVPREHPQPDPDLRRGQAGARRGEHRVGEVGDQPPQLLVEVRHRDRRGCLLYTSDAADD